MFKWILVSPPLSEGRTLLLTQDFTLGKSVSVDKYLCDVCGSKDIKCTYFDFIIFVSVSGDKSFGQRKS